MQGYQGIRIYRDTKVPGYKGMPGYLDIQGYQGTWICRGTRVPGYTGILGYLDIQGYKSTWICRGTRVPGYTGIPGYLDIQGYLGTWIYRDTRVPVYTGISWGTWIQGYQGTWIYRDTWVPGYTGIPGYLDIQGYKCTEMCMNIMDIHVQEYYGYPCTWILWISMCISVQFNLSSHNKDIEYYPFFLSIYLLIYLSVTPWVYDIFMARKTGCKMNPVQFRLIFRHFKYYIKRLLWKRPIWWLEDEPTKRKTGKYCKPLKIWSFYDIWEKFLKELHGSAFGFKNKIFFKEINISQQNK